MEMKKNQQKKGKKRKTGSETKAQKENEAIDVEFEENLDDQTLESAKEQETLTHSPLDLQDPTEDHAKEEKGKDESFKENIIEEDNIAEENGDKEEEEDEEKKQMYEDALAYRQAIERRGVIYMSRVPPFMKPNKARSFLEQYGEVTRLYLAEESPEYRKKRKEHGGNGSKQFREGWIEFADKKIAKRVAESLNNTPMGGKKGDYYHDDLWNLKYLKNFKWEYLTEKFAYEKRIRESKLRAALKQSKKEVEEMKQLIEKSEVEEKIQSRKRNHSSTVPSSSSSSNLVNAEGESSKRVRTFRQEKPIAMEYDESEKKINSNLLQRIFHK